MELFRFLLLLLFFSTCFTNKCIEECNKLPSKYKQVICTNTYQKILLPAENYQCYFRCNITMLYTSSCDCPNHCFEELGNGNCFDQCICQPGWKGKDCSIIKCPENTCSNHGTCVTQNQLDFCKCNHGYTGPTCGNKIPEFEKFNYPDVYPNDRDYYTPNDKYRDHHPIFNISTIATLRVQMEEKDLLRMIDPRNAFTNDWIPMNLTFQNDNYLFKLENCGMRIKGASGRFHLAKNFKIKLSKSQFNLKTIGLKNSGENGFGMRYILSYEMHRALKTPSQRSSFAVLYINDVKYSLYWMAEELDKKFLQSRYEMPNGNLYQGRLVSASLSWRSNDPDFYKNLQASRNGHTAPVYDQKVGNGNYRDLLQLILTINNSTRFEQDIFKILDVERFLRNLAIEAILTNTDGYTYAYHNYYLYFNPKTNLFEFIPYDYSHAMRRKSFRNPNFQDWTNITVLNWGSYEYASNSSRFVPLTHRLLQSPIITNIYKEKLIQSIRNIFNPNSPLIKRIEMYQSFLYFEIRTEYYNRYYLDLLNPHFTNPIIKNEMTWSRMLDFMKVFVRERYEVLLKELRFSK